MSLHIYVPISKIDESTRTVWGYASTPTKDLQGEIVALDAIKSALPDYMEWANIREMHQASAVGVAKEATVDETGLYVGAKIVDDDAWKKCVEKVYKGYSIGGERVSKVGDTITELKLLEISLVDRPANPDCKIEVEKVARALTQKVADLAATAAVAAKPSDGIVLDRDDIGLFGRLLQKLSFTKAPAAGDGLSLPAAQRQPDPLADEPRANDRPLESGGDKGGDTTVKPASRGDAGAPGLVETQDEFKDVMNEEKVEFSDKERTHLASRGMAMEDGSYPIRNVADLERAIHAYGRASDKPKTQAWITRRAKELKATDKLPEDWEGSTKKEKIAAALGGEQVYLAKQDCCIGWGMSTAHQMASIYDQLISLSRSLRYEADDENGDKQDEKWARKVSTLAQALGAILAEKAEHEVTEEKEREAARKSFVSAGITQESIQMSKTIFDGAGAPGGGDPTEIAKRASAAHKAAVTKAAHHLGEARKCFGKAAEHLNAMFSHHMGKAASAEELKGHAEKAHEHLARMEEHHELAASHLHKVTTSWTGEHGQAPVDAESGIYDHTQGLTPLGQNHLTGGEAIDYDPSRPAKGAGFDVAGLIKGFQETLTNALGEVAKAKGEVEYQRGRAETLAAMPAGAPRARLFPVDTGALAGKGAQAPDATKILLDGVDTDAIGRAETPGDARDAASNAASRLISNMIGATLSGQHRFGKSMLSPEFKGKAGH